MVDRTALYRAHHLAVVGSRTYQHRRLVESYVATVASLNPTCVIVSGGAHGVDSWAEEQAHHSWLATLVLRPDWGRGRSAGLLRNSEIVAIADGVLAFWDGASRGTLDTCRKARKKGIPVLVIGPDGAGVDGW